MKGFDYSSDNLYFVTMCVQDRLCCLGSVILIGSAVGTGRDLSVHPNESNPNESNPNESNPNESNPNESNPNESNPNESNPNESNPNESNPNESNPNESNPNESNPNESNPNESNPNESNPNESNPNESNPNESNPNEFLKKMELNKFGEIVQNRMYWLSEQYQYVDIHNFVIMPNHVHVILEINSKKSAGANHGISVQNEEIKIKSLSGLIGAFKTTSSKIIHEYGFLDFAWQRSFHDHIIRNEKSYLNISNYIDSNPDKWTVDTFFENNLKQF